MLNTYYILILMISFGAFTTVFVVLVYDADDGGFKYSSTSTVGECHQLHSLCLVVIWAEDLT
jgi:hypothetical protein